MFLYFWSKKEEWFTEALMSSIQGQPNNTGSLKPNFKKRPYFLEKGKIVIYIHTRTHVYTKVLSLISQRKFITRSSSLKFLHMVNFIYPSSCCSQLFCTSSLKFSWCIRTFSNLNGLFFLVKEVVELSRMGGVIRASSIGILPLLHYIDSAK